MMATAEMPGHAVQGYRSWRLMTGPALRVWQHVSRRAEHHIILPHSEASLAVGIAGGVPHLHVFGPDMVTRDFVSTGDCDLLAVALAAETLEQVTGLSAREWQGVCASAPASLQRAFEPVLARLVELPPRNRLTAWAQAVAQILPTITPSRDRALIACTMLRKTHGRAQVGRVAERLDLSTRQLQRLLRDRTGLSPKMFARQLRLSRAISVADAALCPNWADIAAASGYADQAHLIRDCRYMTERSPAALYRARHDMSEMSNTALTDA